MAHEPIRDQLVTLVGATTNDPGGFLEGLSPIHDEWHAQGFRGYGFLLFHNRVVRAFRSIVNPVIDPPVVAYTDADFERLGVRPFQPDLSGVDALGELAAFSRSIESWHNTAHGALSAATGTPLMDPRQNIFFRPFWQLHLFIDEMFEAVLRQYGDRAHRGQFVAVSAIAAHIEARHHGWVPAI